MYIQAELDTLDNKEYRDAYVDSHVKSLIAHQLRCIRERLGLTQKEFAVLVGKPQSVISRLESTEYGKVNIQTMLDLARKLDIAVVVKFASFPEFLESVDDISPGKLAVDNYNVTKSTCNAVSSFALCAAPTSNVLNQHQIPATKAVLYGKPQHAPVHIMRGKDSVVTAGIAVTPFIGVQLSTSSVGEQHV